ncbi:MAG: protein kinase [Nannocystaceae bacterium]
MDEPPMTWSTKTSTVLGPGDATPHSGDDSPRVKAEGGRPGSFGRFILLSEIGRGGMGVVYTAYDHLLDRRVAIKVVRTDRADAHGRILREAKALAQLSHPNVVQIYDVGASSEEQVYIAMEHVEGETLRGRLAALTSGGVDPIARRATILELYLQAGAGLAAAHAAGLVHRDFKTDNVLVGADGRARVLDFGLVRTREARAMTSIDHESLEPSLVDGSQEALTVEGALLGTPLYMSPEHFAGQVDDPRSDQFSFCAALYEALCGARPFYGATVGELRAAVLCGELRDPGGAVPAWLAAVLRRGLSRRPADRYADMNELLVALSRDPEEARRRRLRLTGVIAAAAVTSVTLVVSGYAGLREWSERRREEAAAADLAIVEARIAAAREAGDPAAAARIFDAFVDEPAHAGTDAVPRAEIAEAARRRADRDARGASSALASAYVGARDRALRVDALVGLADLARDDLDGDRLQRALAVLRRDYPDAAEDPRVRALGVDASLARGDYAQAATLQVDDDPTRPLITALTGATDTSHVDVYELLAALDIDGDGRRELIFSTDQGGGYGLLITAATPSLPTIAETARLGAGEIFALEHERGPLLVAGDGELLRLYAIDRRGELRLLHTRPTRSVLFSATSVDLDGDGRREIFVGTGTELEIVELSLDGDAWRDRVVYSALDSIASAAFRLIPYDHDGDGRPELAATFDGWRAYDVRILGRDPSAPKLRTIARDKLGSILGLAPFRRDGEPGLLVKKVDHSANALVFPPDQPRGVAAGLYFYPRGEGRLAATLHEPCKIPAGASLGSSWNLRVGDLDGDRVDDIAVPFAYHGAEHTLLLRQGEGGALHPKILASARVVGLAQLDDDPADELLVALQSSGAPRLWTLGAGSGRPAFPTAAEPFRVPMLVDPDDPAWSRGWARAVDLAAIGVYEDAGAAFDDLSKRSGSNEHRSQALVASGELRVRAGDHAAARDRFLAAADGPERVTALRGALRAQLRLGEYEAARVSADALLALPGIEVGERAQLRRLTAESPRVDLVFDGALEGAWRFEEPLALAREPATGALRIATATGGRLASLPLEWSGGLVELSIDASVRHTEWSASLVVRIVPEGGGEALVAARVDTSGTSRGGQEVARLYRCDVGPREVWLPTGKASTLDAERVSLRAFASELLEEVGCGLRREGAKEASHRYALRRPLPSPGRYRLEIVAAQDVPAWLEIDLHRITVQGARVAAEQELGEGAAFARALAARDATAALAAAPAVDALDPRAQVWLADAYLQLGQVQKAMSLWPGSVDDPAGGALIDLYRERPALYDPLLRARYGDEYPEWVASIWRNAAVNHLDDPRIYADLGRALAGEFRGAGLDPEGRARVADLLDWRGRLASRMGRLDAARADLEAARGLLDELVLERLDDLELRERRALLLLDLAVLEVEGGADLSARELAREALVTAPAPGLIEDVLRARPPLHAVAEALLRGRP